MLAMMRFTAMCSPLLHNAYDAITAGRRQQLQAAACQMSSRGVRNNDRICGLFVMEFAYSAADALARIITPSDVKLILLLSDINMPGMTGLELLPKVREIRPDVPVLMVSAYGDADTRAKALRAGAAGFFTKPIDFQLLRGEIAERLNTFQTSLSA